LSLLLPCFFKWCPYSMTQNLCQSLMACNVLQLFISIPFKLCSLRLWVGILSLGAFSTQLFGNLFVAAMFLLQA
jgi:hypothetical protein